MLIPAPRRTLQGPDAAANLPQTASLSSPPLDLREAPRRAGRAPNVRREILRVQLPIGLRRCVFFMRSPGTIRIKYGILLARCGLRSAPNALNPCCRFLVSAARPFFHSGKDWHPAGSHKPCSRGSIPRPAIIYHSRRAEIT